MGLWQEALNGARGHNTYFDEDGQRFGHCFNLDGPRADCRRGLCDFMIPAYSGKSSRETRTPVHQASMCLFDLTNW